MSDEAELLDALSREMTAVPPLAEAEELVAGGVSAYEDIPGWAAVRLLAEVRRLRAGWKPFPDVGDWMLQRAEDAATAGLPLDDALQAVRDGYSSIAADRQYAADMAAEEVEEES